MELVTREIENIRIFDLSGRLDFEFISSAESKITSFIQKKPSGNFLFNFCDVEFISSSFLKVIIVNARKITEAKGELKLCCLNKSIKRIFDIVNIEEIVEVFDSEKEAIKSFPLA